MSYTDIRYPVSTHAIDAFTNKNIFQRLDNPDQLMDAELQKAADRLGAMLRF